MAEYSVFGRLISGVMRNVDLASNTIVVNDIKIGGAAGTTLTKTILDNLVSLQDGSEVGSGSHTHSDIYYTETELGSSTSSSGSDLIGDDNTYSNFTPAAATVKGALSGIDTALATAGATEFDDADFKVYDTTSPNNGIVFDVSAVTTADKTITFPDSHIDLGDLAANTSDIADLRTMTGTSDGDTDMGTYTGTVLTDNTTTKANIQELGTQVDTNTTSISDHLADATDAHDASAISNVAAGNIVATNIQAAINELDTEKLALAGGTMSGAIAMGTSKITGLGPGTVGTDAVNKNQLDAAFNDLDRKNGVDLVEIANVTLSGEQTIDSVLTSGSRVLLTGQTDKSKNGIYITDSGAWTRSTDADEASEVTLGMMTTAEQGTLRAGTAWLLTTVSATPTVIDTTELTFTEMIHEATTASTGLTKSDFDIQLADAAENASGIQVSSGAITLNNLDAFDTDGLSEGSSNLYFTEARVRATVLTGIDTSTNADVSAGNSVLMALGYLQANQSDLTDLTGAAQGAVDLGTFTGSVITDNSTIKTALQELETAGEGHATTELNNLGTTAINTTLFPDSNGGQDLGDVSTRWGAYYGGFIHNTGLYVRNSGFNQTEIVITNNEYTPSGTWVNAILTASGATQDLAAFTYNNNTADANPTKSLFLETGNKQNASSTGNSGDIAIKTGDASGTGAGDSGDISLETGTSTGGTRGGIVFKDGSESGAGAGAVWTQAAADGIGGWAAAGAEVTLNADDPTQQTLNLSGQELQVNLATGSTDGAMSAEDKTKLDGIEAGADVTDSTNVDAAGAVMESDTSTASMSFVIDEDDMVSDSATKVPTQQSVKAYVDGKDFTPSTTDESMEAGEAFAASGIFAVRMRKAADAGGTDGRVYKAEIDASSADDFHVIGIALPDVLKADGDNMDVIKSGKLTKAAHGFTVGEPIYLAASGALSNTAPSGTDEAVVKLGIARTSSLIEVAIQIMGVN